MRQDVDTPRPRSGVRFDGHKPSPKAAGATRPAERILGRVARINRYPVKSLQGERLDDATITERGIDGDRLWGIVDRESGKVLTAKRDGKLLEARASHLEGGPALTLPDGTVLTGPGEGTDSALSAWLGRPVTLAHAGGRAHSFDMSFDVLNPDNGMFVWTTPVSSFCDLAPLHLLTTASLGAAAEVAPASDWTVDRFRPSLLIDTGEAVGFLEDEWPGSRLAVGEIVIEVTMPTIRCVLPTKPQPPLGLRADLDIFRALSKHNAQNLGVYANVVTPGRVSVGDPVRLLEG